MIPFNSKEVNMILGRATVRPAEVRDDILKLCLMLDWFENLLDASDTEDTFGTEGWKRYFGVK